MEKTMAVENQENGVRRAPLIFIVPACGFVAAARTNQFQVCQDTREQMPCPVGAQWLTADLTREINPEQSLMKLPRKIASLKSGRVKLLIVLFFGLVAVVATGSCFLELFHPLGDGAPPRADASDAPPK
jgi:hypothetical protein